MLRTLPLLLTMLEDSKETSIRPLLYKQIRDWLKGFTGHTECGGRPHESVLPIRVSGFLL